MLTRTRTHSYQGVFCDGGWYCSTEHHFPKMLGLHPPHSNPVSTLGRQIAEVDDELCVASVVVVVVGCYYYCCCCYAGLLSLQSQLSMRHQQQQHH